MLKIEKYVTMSPEQWEIVIEGARNPMNSWNRMDSYKTHIEDPETLETADFEYFLGQNDYTLLSNLSGAGTSHSKYRRMMPVWVTLVAPLYWWKEFDTYKVGTVANSCSTMHKIHAKEFTLKDFSWERLDNLSIDNLEKTISVLNMNREMFINYDNYKGGKPTKTELFDQMIQLLPSSYNQKRTVMLNYEVLANIYKDRKNHKLPEWHVFCDWIKELPCSELITGEVE